MCKRRKVDEAEELFDQIKKFGCVPSVVTFNVLINGLCKAHKLEEAIHLFSIMEMRQGPDLQEKVEQMYKAGQFLNAYEFLTLTNSRVNPDIITYNILINACCE
ncbi:pentatricopeptide repeat-containing protein, partial [Trifolium medium]|nr:pentatricopeptide repeat-containing protein [Trifolium medium]